MVDSQLKTGKTQQKVCDCVAQAYRCEPDDIWYVVGVACGIGKGQTRKLKKTTTGGIRLEDLLAESTVPTDDSSAREVAASKVLCVAWVTAEHGVVLPKGLF